MNDLNTALGSLEGYAKLAVTGLGFMLVAMLVVFLLYRLVSSFVKPRGKIARMVRVAFGALYVMVILLAVMLAAEHLGYDMSGISGIAILVVIVGAVIAFFAIPFLPRLPFMIGDTVTIRGTMGIVDSITTYQTVLRTFDGRLVYIPNMVVLGSDIQNYSTVPVRRVDLTVQLHITDDIALGKQLCLSAMSADDRVLEDPAPAVFVTGMETGIVSLLGLCWVNNADWFATQDALIVSMAKALNDNDGVQPVVRELNVNTRLRPGD
ncbi:mechanosensitive ion channel [Congregibacter brevis]|uniref:Small-conductance mechanosensitive channel n=1 Tax=Congregibacter brevis TaxID=3081201 RepID=A0ABZ0IDV4_9GAMM|nr:mechanosensitive ion channel [Congregibacter sp. IMCC45268]